MDNPWSSPIRAWATADVWYACFIAHLGPLQAPPMDLTTTAAHAAIRAADTVILVDPRRPGWSMPLEVTVDDRRGGGTLEIPVDSTDRNVVRSWRDAVMRMRDQSSV
jgi:hypothetical protein